MASYRPDRRHGYPVETMLDRPTYLAIKAEAVKHGISTSRFLRELAESFVECTATPKKRLTPEQLLLQIRELLD